MNAQWFPTEMSESFLPAPRRVIPVKLDDGEGLILRQHGNPEGPRLVFSHGNGLAIDMYFPFWRHFLDRFEVIVYDVRNHGWNPPGDPARHTFPMFVFDNERVLDTLDRVLGPKPALGCFTLWPR